MFRGYRRPVDPADMPVRGYQMVSGAAVSPPPPPPSGLVGGGNYVYRDEPTGVYRSFPTFVYRQFPTG